MCGIAGFWSNDGSRRSADALGGRPERSAVLQAMTDALLHRGPDGSGQWLDDHAGVALGHRRLAIVELSDAGAQPMASASGRYQVVYNGELYNHLQLRADIEQAGGRPQWRGHSDTETLLAAFEHWGFEAGLSRLNGMFAIALWDREEQALYLVRDRLGEKPLYYASIGGSLLFGSELRALRAHPHFVGEIDRLASARFLRYCSVPAPQTIYTGVLKLPAAHWVCVRSPGTLATPTPYWSSQAAAPGADAPVPAAGASLIDTLGKRLAGTVESRMMSDVPFGAFLSGGIDSSLVVALMQQATGTPVRTFSIGFEEASHNEAPYAAAVAQHLGTSHTEHYVSSREALDVVPELPRIWDEPFADSSQIPTYLVSRMAREHVTVCLTGDGGDELFGGYSRYAKALALRSRLARLPAPLRRSMAVAAARWAPHLADWLAGRSGDSSGIAGRGGLALDRIVALAEPFGARDDDALYETLVAQRAGPRSLVPGIDPAAIPLRVALDSALPFEERMLQRDILNYLPDVILAKVDRASMAVSLETRAPLLDHDLAEFAASLPWSVKRHEGAGKWPLVTLLRRHLPDSMIDRPKQGFGVPINEWLRGPLREWAGDLLSPQALARHDLLDAAAVTRLWEQHQSHRFDWPHTLWNVLMLQAWLAEHG